MVCFNYPQIRANNNLRDGNWSSPIIIPVDAECNDTGYDFNITETIELTSTLIATGKTNKIIYTITTYYRSFDDCNFNYSIIFTKYVIICLCIFNIYYVGSSSVTSITIASSLQSMLSCISVFLIYNYYVGSSSVTPTTNVHSSEST